MTTAPHRGIVAAVTASERYCPVCGQDTPAPYCPDDGTATVVRGPVSLDATRLEAGHIIEGRYRVRGVLGRGGFGAVYEAEHTGTGQMVAIKVMLADLSEHNVQAVRRFYKEAQVTAQLRHPNTVRVFDVGQTSEGALYIAMERLHGPTLEDVLRELGAQGTAMSERQALDTAIPILRSLAEAHFVDLVHRDLKPANIMLTEVADEEPVVKVLDFGIARTRDSSLTGQGTALGTPAYMSPEQCMGGKVDGRSDLYSLGVILYRCVTGRTPFDDPNPLTVMYKHAHAPPPDPRQVAKSQLSEGTVVCILKALCKKADDRFPTARAMRLALEAVRDGQWEHGLEHRDLTARDRSVVARRRAAQGAAVASPGMTRPYGGAHDLGDADTQALEPMSVSANAGTEEYAGVNAATEPDPSAGLRPQAPQLVATADPSGAQLGLDSDTNRSGETAELALAGPVAAAIEAPNVDANPDLGGAPAVSRRWMLAALAVLCLVSAGMWWAAGDTKSTAAETVTDAPSAASRPGDATGQVPQRPADAGVVPDSAAGKEAVDAGGGDAGGGDADAGPADARRSENSERGADAVAAAKARELRPRPRTKRKPRRKSAKSNTASAAAAAPKPAPIKSAPIEPAEAKKGQPIPLD